MPRTRRVVLGFTYIFLVMTSYYILKPVRESFFVGQQGYRNLPIAHLLVLAATYVAFLAYTKVTRELGPARLVTATNAFFLVCLGIFWILLSQFSHIEGLLGKLSWVYFCWVSVYAVFAVTMFWSVIHTVFTPDEGAKGYGYIGAGATLGAMTGGALTNRLAEPMGTENLLLVAIFVLTPCLVLGRVLTKLSLSPEVGTQLDTDQGITPPSKNYRAAIELLRKSPYLLALGFVVMLWILIMVLDEYRYYKVIQFEIEDQDQRTAFFGAIPFYANLIGLFFSLVVTRPVLSRWGPRPGLLLFTSIILISAVAMLVAPGLRVVAISLVALQAIGYSIGQWSRELLYTPVSTEEKFVAKGFIDTFMFRAGAGTASLALIAATRVGSGEDGLMTNAATQLSWVTIPLCVVLAVLVWWITGQFQRLKNMFSEYDWRRAELTLGATGRPRDWIRSKSEP